MDNLANSYVGKKQTVTKQFDVSEMDDFVTAMRTEPGYEPPMEISIVGGAEAPKDVTVPGKLEQRRPTEDPLGRQLPGPKLAKQPTSVIENIVEIPAAIGSGAYNAVMNAVDPLADWINSVVPEGLKSADFKPIKMGTPTGSVVQAISQFVTGFIPAAKGLEALGVAGKIANPALAGAVSDFTTRGGHEGRLADVWAASGLPGADSDFVKFMQTDKESPELIERFKTAVEGVVPGLALDGLISAIRYTKSLYQSNKIINGPDSEIAILKDKYGELTDEDIARHFGDPSKPVVETRIAQSPKMSEKIAKIEGEIPALEPRALIRTQKKTAVAPEEFLPEFKGVFSKDALDAVKKDAVAGDNKVRIVMMSPDDYNKLAFPREQTYKDLSPAAIKVLGEEKRGPIRKVIESGKGLDEIPFLGVQGNKVVGHEGRHRMDVFKERGIKLIPVRIKGKLPESGAQLISETGEHEVKLPEALVRPSAEAASGIKSEDFETYVNFARIDEPEQVKFTIGKMAEAMKGSVDESRRGVITQKATQDMADDLGMTVADLLERRKGQPLNAEETLAARQLWAASGEKLLAAAKKAANPNAGDIDQFTFRRSMAVHAAIQNEVIGARTETARALAQWRIPAGSGIEKARAIQQVMAAAGSPGETKEMARRLAILAESGANPAAIANFAQKGWGATSLDAIKEAWVNGLLSSPKTHMVNISSNTGVALQQVYERAVAGGIRNLIGGDGVKAGESIAMVHGLKGSVRDAFKMAAISLKTGETGYAFSKIDVSHPNSISAEAFRMSGETSAGKFVDFLGHAATIPGRLLGAEDEFFKTIGYRMEVHAQAFRQASSEGLSGDKFAARTKELVENPPEHIRINAADAAMYSTFSNEVGWFGKAIMNLRDSGSSVGQMGITLVLPFVRTPTNIARYTFERTPFAPLVGQWRADIAAGGARSDLALARMSTGTAIMLTAMDWANDGAISGAGPTDNTEREALMRSGWQPHSIYANGKWFSYNRADPFGATMGFAASITEAVNRGEIDQEDADEWQEVTAMSIAAVSQVVINKTYMEGMSNFVEMMSDPKRHSESYINNLVGSFTPYAALSSAVETAVDPTQREVGSPWEAVEARIAGLSEKLPPRRNLWGEPIKAESGMGKVYDFMSPVAVREQDVAPVDREIVRLGGGPQRIKKRGTFDGVPVSFKQYPEIYDEYVRLSGNGLKNPAWDTGAKDYLNAVVSGKHPMSVVWDILPDEKRRDFIESTVRDYRGMAQRQIMADPKFAKFASMVNYLKGAQQQSKMPVFGE